MITPIAYSRRGGARVGAFKGSWPFGKIAISNGCVIVSALGKSCRLTTQEVLRIESLSTFNLGTGPGLRLFYRGQHWEEHVDFYSIFGRDEVLAVLKSAGFNVVVGEA